MMSAMPSTRRFTAYIQRDAETGLYVGVVPGVQGAHTQAASLDELHANLKEVLALCLEGIGEDMDEAEFVGVQQIEMTA